MEKQFRTISLLVAGLVVFSFLGFYKTYFHLFPQFRGTAGVVHFHVLTVLCWFAMLVGQAALAAKGRLDLHRKIGKASYLLFPVILSGFVLMADGWATPMAGAPAPEGLSYAGIAFGGALIAIFALERLISGAPPEAETGEA